MSGPELVILSFLLMPVILIITVILDFLFQDRRNK